MGLGTANVVKGCKSGGLITIVLLTTYRVIDYIMSDEQTLTHLVGSLAADVVKVGISVGAALVTLAIVGGTTIAIGPLAAAIVVGGFASLTLDHIDAKYGLTNKVVAGLQAINDSVSAKKAEFETALSKKAAELMSRAFDYVIAEARDAAVDLIGNYARRFMTPEVIR